MRFFLLPALCLVGSAIASTVVPQDTSVIERYVASLTRSLGLLDDAFRQIPPAGDPALALQITEYLIKTQAEYVETLRVGSRDIRFGPSAVQGEMTRLKNLINAEGKVAQAVMTAWIRQKDMVVAAGKREAVLDQLVQAADGAVVFSEVVNLKLPKSSSRDGATFKVQFGGNIEMTINAYRS